MAWATRLSSDRLRVLVVGNGYVGSRLAEHLASKGDEAFVLTRRSPVGHGVPVVADLLEAPSLGALPDSLDAVVYLMAPDARNAEAYERVFGTGLENLLGALDRRRPMPRFILTSSTAVYGDTGGRWVNESSPTEDRGWRARSLLGAERRLGASMDSVVVRLAGIYGPGRTPLLCRLRDGRARLRPGVFANRIHLEDVVGAYDHLLRLPAPDPLYLGVDSNPALQEEMLEWLARTYAVPPAESSSTGNDSLSVGANRRCSNRRLIASGYRFRFPSYRDGYLSLVASA